MEARALEGQMRKKREKGTHRVESDAYGAARERMRTAGEIHYGVAGSVGNASGNISPTGSPAAKKQQVVQGKGKGGGRESARGGKGGGKAVGCARKV